MISGIDLMKIIFASTGLWSVLAIIVTAIINKKKKSSDSVAKANNMLKGLAHDRICYLGERYIERGWISRDEYENLYDYLYVPYAALGGNGTAKKVIDEVNKLPIIKNESISGGKK